MKVIIRRLFLLVGYFSFISSSFALDITIDPKDQHMVENVDTGNGVRKVIKDNPNYFYNKEYDIGFKEQYSFKKLLNFVGYSDPEYFDQHFHRYTEEENLKYALKKLDIDTSSDFTYHKIKKEKDKYISIFNESLNRAKKYIREIKSVEIKDYSSDFTFTGSSMYPTKFVYTIPDISKDSYDFDKEILYLAPLLKECDLNCFLGNNDEFKAVKVASNLECKVKDCYYYINIPSEIAETLYNLRMNGSNYLVLSDIKLKPLNNIDRESLYVSIDKIEIIFVDAKTNYAVYSNNLEEKLNSNMHFMSDIPSEQLKELLSDRKELYRAEVKVDNVGYIPEDDKKYTVFHCKTENGKEILVEKDRFNKEILVYNLLSEGEPERTKTSWKFELDRLLSERRNDESKLIFNNNNYYYHIYKNANSKGLKVFENFGDNEKLISTEKCI